MTSIRRANVRASGRPRSDGAANEEAQLDGHTIERMAQFLTTEHTALQGARQALAVEGSGRTTSFLTTISAGIVALALVAQLSRFSDVFLLFSLVLLPILGFVGVSTYARMVQVDLADFAYAAAINRIRRFYLRTAPELGEYLSFPAFDDGRSVREARVDYTSLAWTVISYPSGFILVINSLLAGALCSLTMAGLLPAPIGLAAGAGAVVFLLAAGIQYWLAVKWSARLHEQFPPRFPKPGRADRPRGWMVDVPAGQAIRTGAARR